MRQTHTLFVAYVLCLLGGVFGLHRFYYNSKKLGYLYLFTLGLLGLGWLYDLFTLPRLHQAFMQRPLKQGSANYTLAWMLLILFGYLGFHKLYLRQMPMFFLYFMTFGFLGIGVIVDLSRLNERVEIFNLNEGK